MCMDDSCDGDAYTGTPTCKTGLVNAQIKGGNATAITGWQMVRGDDRPVGKEDDGRRFL